jgi:hypothetical protein
MRVNLRGVLLLNGGLLLIACAGRSTESVAWRTARAERWQDSNHYVRMLYPVLIGRDGVHLNPIIQHWIGSHCANLDDPGQTYPDAKACMIALFKDCSDVGSTKLNPGLNACIVNIRADVVLDAAGMLAIKMELDSYGGGAHELVKIEDLNLDLHSDTTLGLDDFLDHYDKETLAHRITDALRVEQHIPADQSLTQAGFLTDDMPVPPTVLALPEGLLFTYQSYDIASFSGGQPQVLLPYADLSDIVRASGPLPRLHALLATSEVSSE